jgi:ATP-dependent DNA helicase RecG
MARLIDRAAGGERLVDLCWRLPTGLIDRRFKPKVAEAPDGAIVTLTVEVGQHRPSRGRAPYRVLCFDDSAPLTLVFFHAKGDYLSGALPPGAKRVVSGRVQLFNGEAQMAHPDFIVTPEEAASLPEVQPVYPLTEGLSPKVMLKAVEGALAAAPELPEWLDPALGKRERWPAWRAALAAAHAPKNEADFRPDAPARRRLAYDELLANQLALALVRAQHRRLSGRAIKGDGRLRAAARKVLPYALTGAQEQALREIERDVQDAGRMLRLLQGDVGSGKTVVALLAMLAAVEAGAQAALMAPTEILARQHFETLRPVCEAVGVRLEMLTGRAKGRTRADALERLALGQVDLVVGTHALFQEDVAFKDLGLAVIDEQHRFGVHQRLTLAEKGRGVNVLVMTATPIPRTLTLTAYGDMDVSRLDEKPPGRAPIETRAAPLVRLDETVERVRQAVERGARAYWVCPLVEESDALDVAAAEERYAALKQVFGAKVGLLHGRQDSAQKDRAMAAFAAGEVAVLVATTVIEVGVDVPEATIMVIEHAERFGLAQLHQLRGRVGRGGRRGACLLLYAEPLSETARARIETLRKTDDGFVIAEEDLRLRGAGDLLGARQSGLPEFRLADLAAHQDLMETARDDARLILERDPELKSARGEALRILLYLFERDAAVRTLRSG